MPIWIKSGNSLLLCNGFEIFIYSDNCSFQAYMAIGSISQDPCISVRNLTEQQAQDLMRDITRAVASGDRYFEIPERYIQNERT